MIISIKKINNEFVFIRFFQYLDTERGYGDAGTKFYKKIPLSKFKEEKSKRFDGSYYYKYSLDQKYGEELIGKYWWIDNGYDLSDKSKRDDEIKQLEARIKSLKSNR